MAQTTLPGGSPPVLSVAELTARVKETLEADFGLQDVYVKGEVSNLFVANSGHAYFTLKDDSCELRCVMWRDAAARMPDGIADGSAVLARGALGVYALRGQYQLYVRELQPEGLGLLWVRLAALKKKLEAEGLFAAGRKRPLPAFPRRVGVVTSRDGAALHDILQVLGRRASYLDVVVADARVQGAEAAPSLVAAIGRLGRKEHVDVLIVGRGGGSIEDLWAFNDEAVVRAIAACPVPVIAAVGHETDWTLADLVADWRAPTPSAAAERVAPSADELCARLLQTERRLASRLRGRLDLARARVEALARRPVLSRPDALFAPLRQSLDEMSGRMPRALDRHLERVRARVAQTSGVLDALSPLKTLARGFAVASVDGRTVRRIADAPAGSSVAVRVADGVLDTHVQRARGVAP